MQASACHTVCWRAKPRTAAIQAQLGTVSVHTVRERSRALLQSKRSLGILGKNAFPACNSPGSMVYYTLSYLRRDGRVVEGAALEMLYRGNSIVGSNPTLSAIFMLKNGGFAPFLPHFFQKSFIRAIQTFLAPKKDFAGVMVSFPA